MSSAAERVRDKAVNLLRHEATRTAVSLRPNAEAQEEADLMAALADTIAARPVVHILQVNAEHTASLMHPLIGCGTNLFDCPVSQAMIAAGQHDQIPAGLIGRRYECGLDDNGFLIGREVTYRTGDEPDQEP